MSLNQTEMPQHKKHMPCYVDDEGDVVSITSDSDLAECIRINLNLQNEKLIYTFIILMNQHQLKILN